MIIKGTKEIEEDRCLPAVNFNRSFNVVKKKEKEKRKRKMGEKEEKREINRTDEHFRNDLKKSERNFKMGIVNRRRIG